MKRNDATTALKGFNNIVLTLFVAFRSLLTSFNTAAENFLCSRRVTPVPMSYYWPVATRR